MRIKSNWIRREAYCKECDQLVSTYYLQEEGMYHCPQKYTHVVSTASLNPNYQEVA